jgi:hypothetical protein
MKFLVSLILILVLSLSAFAQQSAESAEERISRMLLEGNAAGLAVYARALAELARDQKALIAAQQEALSQAETAQKKFSAQFRIDLNLLQKSIIQERAERQKLTDLLTSTSKRGWRQMVQSGATGATVGAMRSATWAAIGGAVGIAVELIIR